MIFGKKNFWKDFDGRLSFEEGGDTGGEGGGGSSMDTSSSTIETSSESGSGSQGDGSSGSVLDNAPSERGSQEYNDWFSNLSYEERVKAEEDLAGGYEFKPKTAETKTEGDAPAGGTQSVTPDGDVGEWTPEEFAKLDSSSQVRIQQMQGIIDKFAPYLDGSLDKGLEIVQNDPLIKARLQEIQANGEHSIPEAVTKQFNVLDYLSPDDQKVYSLLDEKGKTSLLQTISRAFEDGARRGQISEQYNTREALLKEQRINNYTKQLDGIVTSTPSLKVPLDASGNPVPYKDPNHPMNPYLRWASSNLSDAQLDKIGHKAGYAAYLAATGQQDVAMENVAKNVRTSFFKEMDKLDKTIATTAGRNSQSPAGPGTKVFNGIDLNKYKTDTAYRQQVFSGADQKTKQKLEQFIYDGNVPTNN